MIRKIAIVLNWLLTGYCVYPLVLLAKMTATREVDFWLLIAVIVLGGVSVMQGAFSIVKEKLDWTYTITTLIFFSWVVYTGATVGILGLILLAVSTGGKYPAGMFALIMMFNVNWGWGSYKSEMPRVQESTKVSNNFMFMLSQVATTKAGRFELPRINTSSYGKIFIQTTKVDFAGGAAMKISAGSNFKVTEVNKSSYGSTYKVESSKPVTFGVGAFSIKFKQATIEVSNNYQVKVLAMDAKGNRWLQRYIMGNSFNCSF